MSEKALVKQGPRPDAMLMTAIEKGMDADALGRLMDLSERWEANEARKAFTAAMAAFRAEAPAIRKNAQVDFATAKGRTSYMHASLDHICEIINPILSRHGLTYSWVTEQTGGSVTVHCDVTHVMGHRERVSLSGPYDQSGNKNGIQAIGSAVTYLSRYTVISALGLATGGQDDDGVGASVPKPEADPVLLTKMREVASQGMDAYRAAYEALTVTERKSLAPHHSALKTQAAEA